ncbi:MAG TPA: DinB family protein [Pirellulales bacterium]|nr:DinB family protein [Pirellulales bacterium]
MSARDIAWGEIDAARRYSLGLLESVHERDWFRQPTEGITHIAWQMGHLAAAQYSLCLLRLRGAQDTDAQILPPKFTELFLRGTAPVPDPAKYPAPAEILETLGRVQAAVETELARHADADLEQPQRGKPHPLFTTTLGGLFWCARHEMLHAGQVGLLKRLLGYAPKW